MYVLEKVCGNVCVYLCESVSVYTFVYVCAYVCRSVWEYTCVCV